MTSLMSCPGLRLRVKCRGEGEREGELISPLFKMLMPKWKYNCMSKVTSCNFSKCPYKLWDCCNKKNHHPRWATGDVVNVKRLNTKSNHKNWQPVQLKISSLSKGGRGFCSTPLVESVCQIQSNQKQKNYNKTKSDKMASNKVWLKKTV